MSIPPLVCSTPPPPDQCEDEIDPDEFDVQYSLSQDDEDEGYGGIFTNYNHFQSSKCVSPKPDDALTIKVVQNDLSVDSKEVNINSDEMVGVITTASESKFKLEEDINIEDLNLKVDDGIERTGNVDDKDSCVDHEIGTNKVDIVKEIDFENNPNSVLEDNLNTCALPDDTKLDTPEEIPIYVEEITEQESNDLQVDVIQSNILSENVTSIEETKENSSASQMQVESLKLGSNVDDDFGDFDDFQFVSSDAKSTTVIDNCDNPWDSKKADENDFGDFKANFDENERKFESLSQDSQLQYQTEKTEIQSDDDFGEFDDFKSSVNEDTGENERNLSEEDSLSCQHTPVLNLQSQDSETQVIDSINKLLSSIFVQEISKPESDFDGKLESLLGETWGHLLETDVRQPYVINWNNSLGQKTLLRALCIDSRNILFGPKWSYNMPKYAANLSTAPLQPQKQLTPSNITQTENSTVDKNGAKTAGTWSDPFTTDGQESCSTDSGTENNPLEVKPTDLDVFEGTIASKPEKIYSSTLNIQPIRQINLPDTHIFTPTDSETPRSKTIHYDNSSAVIIPQSVIEENKHSSENLAPQPSTSSNSSDLNNDNEYWEFQDFKGTSNTLTPSSASQQTVDNMECKTSQKLPNLNITYGTQVLQPIKVEPIMPKLNWPDPGEVKETFDDFSDFISNSSWSNKQTLTVMTLQENNPIIETECASVIINNDGTESNNGDNFDDEFDTFQSAFPAKNSHEYSFNHANDKHNDVINMEPSSSPQTKLAKREKLDINLKIENNKSDTISFPSIAISNDNLQYSKNSPVSLVANNIEDDKIEFVIKSLPTQTSCTTQNNILQPTIASSSAVSHQQKATQILEPLSLESYSQINWPNPGIDLQDLSRFNPVETLNSLKTDLSANSHSKVASPAHSQKSGFNNQVSDDDIWGEFVSSKPKQQQALPKKSPTFGDDEEWTDFVSSPSVKPQNGLNTISLNVHTNLNIQKSSNPNKFAMKANQIDIPTLNYITPKSSTHKSYNDRHFQNL